MDAMMVMLNVGGVIGMIDRWLLWAAAGVGDRVLCFRCGEGLKDWQPEEDPWEEHAKHYPG